MKIKLLTFLLSTLFLSSCMISDFGTENISPTIKEPLSESKNIKIESNNLVWTLESGEKFTDEYYVFDKTVPSQLKGIFSADMFLLTPEDYAIFKEKTKNHECPASFFNSNAVIMSVLSENNSLLSRLNKLKTGDKVVLNGNDVTYTVERPNGESIEFSLDSKVNPVYLKDVQVN